MKRVKLIVAYDGTGYCGWQVQPNEITVEGVLNKHISELTGEDIKVIGASRTDSGVHALGNVAVSFPYSRQELETSPIKSDRVITDIEDLKTVFT